MPYTYQIKRAFFITLFGAFFLFIVFMGTKTYEQTRAIMRQQIKQEILSMAIIGALDLQEEVYIIREIQGESGLSHPGLPELVEELKHIRDSSEKIRFVYIMRKTDDPNVLEFVADADSLSSDAELDINANGKVDANEEASYPGDTYDISTTPAMQGPAFEGPVTDEEFSKDEWGTWMSAYAPIVDSQNNVIAILGIDMSAASYQELENSVFPLMFLLAILSFVLCFISSLVMFFFRTSERMAVERATEMTEKVHQTSMLMQSIIRNLPVALFCKDVQNEYRFVLWNKRSEEIFGLLKPDVIGKNDYDFFPKDQADFFRKTDQGVMDGGQIVEIAREPVNSKNGTVYVHTKKVPILDEDGKPRYLLGISEIVD